MTVRVRTTVAAMLVVGVALFAVALSLLALPRQSLFRRLDTQVRTQAQELALGIRRGVPLDDVRLPNEEGDFFRVFGEDGALLSSGGETVSVPAPPIGQDVPFEVRTERFDGDAYRVLIQPAVGANGEVAYIFAGVATAPVEEAIGVIRRVLVVSVPMLVGLVGVAAWLVTGRALRPVERIRRQVAEISASEMHRRVPEPDADDEVARLARTMNEMLDRLEASTDRQRRFVSDASHELRSPLATIRAQMEVALASGTLVDWPSAAQRVLHEEQRLHRLVDDLLVLARTDEASLSSPVDIDLDQLVTDDADRHGAVVDASGIRPARVRGDLHRLAGAVRNLLDNAVRHASTTVAVSLDVDGDDAVLHVDDDGPGIAAADRVRVFERFTRLDDARARDAGGAGLGLAVVHAVVAAHGGTSVVTESPLGGARFTVRLPRID